jgi:subtilisin family serine protease
VSNEIRLDKLRLTNMKKFYLFYFIITSSLAYASSPVDWHHLSPSDGYEGIRSQEAYEKFGLPLSDKIIVAVLDSGVDINHEDLAGKIWTNPGEIPDNGIDDDNNGYSDDTHGWDFITKTNDVISLDSEHGTHVAGIIAAKRNNNLGVQGIASNVLVMPLRVIPEDEVVDSSTDDLQYKETAEAILYAVKNGAKIINMSFGWNKEDKNRDLLESAMRYAEDRGVLIVQAAGNETLNIDINPYYPSRINNLRNKDFENFIVVGASNENLDEDLVCPFSNYGKKNVDIFAPGMFIRSTTTGNKYDSKLGTSASAPMVSGAAALLLSYKNDLSASDIKSILLRSARRYSGFKVYNWGCQLDDCLKDFGEFSVSGGILDVFEAVVLINKKL